MQAYGTGSDLQRAAQAVTAALQGLAGGNLAGALAGASAPYLAQQIKQVAGDNETARLMAHAVLGAVVAQAQGNAAAAAAAGAAGALSGELIAKQVYPGKAVDELSEDEKQTVSALATLASGLAGAVVGGDASSALAGADAGKNAVDNNHLTLDGRMYLKQKEREYASACGGAAGASDDCQKRADEIGKLRKLGDSVLETEHTVVGSEMGPDQFTPAQPGDIVACANSSNGFCQVTDEAIQTPAGKEWKLVAASDAEAAGQAQRDKMEVDRATMAAEKFGLDAYNAGCGSSGVIGVACQLFTSLGGANPINGYEPTTGDRVLAGAGAILNSLGLVGAIRGGGVGGSAAESSVGSGAKVIPPKNQATIGAIADNEAGGFSYYDQFKKADGGWDWPKELGFSGDPIKITLPVGTKLDRYGGLQGSFLSPQGVPFEQRALAPGSKAEKYYQCEVLKPLPVVQGKIAPAFGQPGGGTQILPDLSERFNVERLVKEGYLRRTN
ncbi:MULTISPECIES: glycohydrolase toxin TNT-related protein [Pseudomonas]|uniref:glycohydrolase toxin TNT-related protein n=1 Tax=Pseudomonas TaxID=286 RepID=UPI001E4BC003|nr:MULTISPECIES: glycohydrolase toxin TNT-related protein [Pseudomonas]MCE1114313.1 glycohydrolase toxin TNT-related protein [Pseudomonas sp. NMI795_08]